MVPEATPPKHLNMNDDNEGHKSISDCIRPGDLRQLEKNLMQIIAFGYGELIIHVDKGKITGHDMIIRKRYGVFSGKK